MGDSAKRLSAARRWAGNWGHILLVIALAAHLFLVVRFHFTQDDAFITFRYADNFINGQGLVFNSGEQVEGYTNFFWVVLMMAGRLAGIDYVWFSWLAGTACGLAAVIILFLFLQRLSDSFARTSGSMIAGIGAVLLGANYSFAYWTISGLETAAFTLAVMATVFFYQRRSILVAWTSVMAVLLRPEGALVLALLVIYEVLAGGRPIRYALIIGAVSTLFLLPYLGFKLLYYGSLLPNPFFAKTRWGIEPLMYGLEYTGTFLWHYLAAGLFLVPVLFALRRAAVFGTPTPGGAAVRLPALLMLAYTAYIILVGGDVLKVHRFFVPILPLIVIVLVRGLGRLLSRPLLIAGSAAVILAWQLVVPYRHVTTFLGQERQLGEKMEILAGCLHAADPTPFTLAATTIGRIGYGLPGRTIIDLLGLTDSTIARHPEPPIKGLETTWREAQYNSRYVLERQPDYILFSTGTKPSAPAERALLLHSAFLRSYRTINFFFRGAMNAVYKRYYPVTGEIRRDIDTRFVQFFNLAINLESKDTDLPNALAALDSADRYCPVKDWPYIKYYQALVTNKMGWALDSYHLMKEMAAMDTLAIEALVNLCRYEYQLGDYERAYEYYNKALALCPWHKPVLDGTLAAIMKRKGKGK